MAEVQLRRELADLRQRVETWEKRWGDPLVLLRRAHQLVEQLQTPSSPSPSAAATTPSPPR
jgi:hypothetical protein